MTRYRRIQPTVEAYKDEDNIWHVQTGTREETFTERDFPLWYEPVSKPVSESVSPEEDLTKFLVDTISSMKNLIGEQL
jgi:hypothetical protein